MNNQNSSEIIEVKNQSQLPKILEKSISRSSIENDQKRAKSMLNQNDIFLSCHDWNGLASKLSFNLLVIPLVQGFSLYLYYKILRLGPRFLCYTGERG